MLSHLQKSELFRRVLRWAYRLGSGGLDAGVHPGTDRPGDGAPSCHALPVLLFHLTSRVARASIEESGAIETTWPKIVDNWPWPRVAWLTSEPSPAEQGWKVSEPKEVRFTVDVPDEEVLAWTAWREELPPHIVRAYEGWGKPLTWFVVRRPIPSSEWVGIDDLR